MPAMPRAKCKATKIAYEILGLPMNIDYKKKKSSHRSRRLIYEETRYVK